MPLTGLSSRSSPPRAANRLTSASAEIDSEVIRLSRKMFRRILEEYPDVAVKLHQRILDDFQAMIARIEKLAPRFGG